MPPDILNTMVPIFVTVSQILIEWSEYFVHQDNIWQTYIDNILLYTFAITLVFTMLNAASWYLVAFITIPRSLFMETHFLICIIATERDFLMMHRPHRADTCGFHIARNPTWELTCLGDCRTFRRPSSPNQNIMSSPNGHVCLPWMLLLVLVSLIFILPAYGRK